jgi:hypothetical protein
MVMEDIINILISIGGAFLIIILLHISIKLNCRNIFDKTGREYYKEVLFSLLADSKIKSIKTAYYLCCTEATPKNLSDIKKYVKNKLYFMLERMFSRVPIYEDEYGDVCFNSNFYKIILVIDNENNYNLVIIFEELIGEYSTRLEEIIEVNRFLMVSTLWYFDKELIYKA